MFDYTICNCKKVTFFDVEDALNKFDKFEDLKKTSRKFRKSPTVWAGCGGCHGKILDAISEIMSK